MRHCRQETGAVRLTSRRVQRVFSVRRSQDHFVATDEGLGSGLRIEGELLFVGLVERTG